MSLLKVSFLLWLCLHTLLSAQEAAPKKAAANTPAVSSITEEEIAGFAEYAPDLQKLIRKAIELTQMTLGYQFGSSDPKAGGMDCSGTIYHLLQSQGFKEVPRQSDEICRWVMRHSVLYRTENALTLKDAAFTALKPGDLLLEVGWQLIE